MNSIEKDLLGINSWDSFFSHANSLSEKGKGDLFEHLTYLMLITRPEYTSILKNVWLQGQKMPQKVREKINLPANDVGIDLVAETVRGEFWAIQCKFKGQNQAPTYKELSTFTYLANTYCKNISLAVLVHTGEKGVKRKSLLGEKYTEIGLDFWLNLSQEDWVRIHNKLKNKSVKPEPRKPRQHQIEAIKAAKDYYLKDAETKGRLIMPCGTGKSLTAFWIANSLKAESIIVAVPSLYLIKQSLQDWTKEFIALGENPRPEWLVICSDDSTGNLDKDEFVSDTYSLGIPTTTKIDDISSFLKKKHTGRKIIFTTYQSSDRLAKASQKSKFKFDLAILDESHKTVGEKSKSFATLLSDKNIVVKKRMFMTATERVVRGQGDDVYSMDDENIYGKRIYQLSFKDAIHSNPPIICDYKILTITVSNSEIQQIISDNNFVVDREKRLQNIDAQSIASAIALRKATNKYGIKHAISFHKSIKSAEEFSKLNNDLNQLNIDKIKLPSLHISSKKSAGERERLMQDFSKKSISLMTNARCLTEGVDVPAVDCVLFADPKQSVVDIVQAAGRALRPFKGKDFGYIMMPLIVPDDMNFEDFFETTPFRQIAKIITALSTQDERIAEEFRITTSGKSSTQKRIIIDGTIPVGLNIDFKEMSQQISIKFWEKVGRANWRPFIEARDFIRDFKLKNQNDWSKFRISSSMPCDIPSNPNIVYKDNGWVNLGDWLGTGVIASKDIMFLPFKEARTFCRNLKLKSQTEWFEFCKSNNKPANIPQSPSRTYKNSGWVNWGDWLGTGRTKKEFLTYGEAKKIIHRFKIKSQKEWNDFVKTKQRPTNIPYTPSSTYKNKGWVSWGDWLGTNRIADSKKTFLSFLNARKQVHAMGLKNAKEWFDFCKSNLRPPNIPSAPHLEYKDSGWKGWGDWLGTNNIANKRTFRDFNDAKMFVRQLNLKSSSEWIKYCKSGKKPIDIPQKPYRTYKNNGWINMGDWLGTGTIASQLRQYRSFEDAKKFIHSLGLKKQSDWFQFIKSGQKPDDIPADPSKVYKNKGWVNWGDWLGKI